MVGYPQMQPFAEKEILEFLSRPLLAKICTLNKDGSIHVTPLFFGYADGDILLGTHEITRKVRNIKRNQNVTVLIDDGG